MLDYSERELLGELAATHAELAQLHEEIAFGRVTEFARPEMKPQRLSDEGHRDALIEKKFLIIRLLDARKVT